VPTWTRRATFARLDGAMRTLRPAMTAVAPATALKESSR
jgi:hypothetical protein